MAIAKHKVTPGSVLLDIHSHQMGNTTMRRLGCWRKKPLIGGTRVLLAICLWRLQVELCNIAPRHELLAVSVPGDDATSFLDFDDLDAPAPDSKEDSK